MHSFPLPYSLSSPPSLLPLLPLPLIKMLLRNEHENVCLRRGSGDVVDRMHAVAWERRCYESCPNLACEKFALVSAKRSRASSSHRAAVFVMGGSDLIAASTGAGCSTIVAAASDATQISEGLAALDQAAF